MPGLDPARALLQRHFGYGDFRPLQTRVLTAWMEGRDVLAVLPTGAGKSICFQIPALLTEWPTLVVSPLISLMQDQVAAATARGVPAAAIHSLIPRPEQRDLLTRASRGEVRLLYTSPERLKTLAPELAERNIRPGLLAVDEAHCISEWGSDFRPAYRTLRRLRAALGWPQVVALTGSATPAVRRDILRSLGMGGHRGMRTILGSFDRRNLWLGVARVSDERERFAALVAALRMQDALAIVYAPTRNLVEELARVLGESGFRAAPYHAGLTPAVRRDVLHRFLGDELGVVVATCAFGMGIDKPNVRQVVHWTLPATPEAYYQEAGRAGRDGSLARCLLLYRPGDATRLRSQLYATPSARPPDRLSDLRRREAEGRIATMERYARDTTCRRKALLRYFGESLPRCAGCDVCSRGAPKELRNPEADRRLAALSKALRNRATPWGGAILDPVVLRRLASNPPLSEAELARVDGVGPVLASRYSGTILQALGVLGPPPLRAAPDSADPYSTTSKRLVSSNLHPVLGSRSNT